MGSNMTASFAYGVSLGTEEDPLVGPKDEEYGGFSDQWLSDHDMDDNDPEREWSDILEEAILAAAGFTEEEPEIGSDTRSGWYDRKRQALEEFGADLEWSGGQSTSGLLLVIRETLNEVDWTDVFRVDARALLAREARGPEAPSDTDRWDAKLAKVLGAAGLTPDEDNTPGWLVWAECSSGDH